MMYDEFNCTSFCVRRRRQQGYTRVRSSAASGGYKGQAYGCYFFLENVCALDRNRRGIGRNRNFRALFSFVDGGLFVGCHIGARRIGSLFPFVFGCSPSYWSVCGTFGRVCHLLDWIFLDLWVFRLTNLLGGQKKTPSREFYIFWFARIKIVLLQFQN